MRIDTVTFAVAIRTAFNLLAIMAAWHFIFVPAIMDRFRQRIFSLRRDMFLYMARGHIDRNHPAFIELRQTMNESVRHVHRINFFRLLLIYFCLRKAAICFDLEVDEHIDSIEDATVRNKMRSYDHGLADEMRGYFARRSPLISLAVRVWTRYLRPLLRRGKTSSPGIVRRIEVDARLYRRTHKENTAQTIKAEKLALSTT
jgi:hypothetical protein